MRLMLSKVIPWVTEVEQSGYKGGAICIYADAYIQELLCMYEESPLSLDHNT